MERQYSPGRTWEATARALIGLLDLGDVLDIACGDGGVAALGKSPTITGEQRLAGHALAGSISTH
jgi:hypothetical protein